MLKNLKLGIFALAAVGLFFVSCANETEGNEGEMTEASVTPAGTTESAANTPEAATNTQSQQPSGPTTSIEFSETEYDFGVIDQGESASHTFMFTNTGDEPLIISSAKGSCGCTVPKWPKEPIAPGETGELQVEFNSKGKRGKQNKKVTVTANTNPPQSFIYFKGDVNAPETTGTKTNVNVQ